MKKKILIILITTLVSNGFAYNIFVSQEGSDDNNGSKGKPLATVAGAIEALAERGINEDVKVIIGDGVYRIDEPLVFRSDVFANKKYTVTFKAQENSRPVISGGRIVTGWEKEEGDLWTAQIPEVKNGKVWFRSLYKDGQRLTRSREPDYDYFKIKAKQDFKHIQLKQKPGFDSLKGQNTEIFMVANWSINRGLIEKIKGNTVVTKTNMGRSEHPWTSPQVGRSVFFEHALEFVDQPGEWYLDQKTGKIFYMADEGENPNQHEFVYPVLKHLVILEGTQKEKLKNLHFKNLSFEHSSWQLPEEGYLAVQACYYGYKDAEMAGGCRVTYLQPAAVKLKYVRNSSFYECNVSRTSASAISIGAGCENVEVQGGKIFDIGANGIHIGHHDEPIDGPDQDWLDKRDVPRDIKVLNNYIHHCGQINWGAVGVFTAFTENTVISHNLITDLPYTGIMVGFKWSSVATSHKKSKVTFNRVNTVMTRLADGGGIYTLGYQPGTEILNNLVYDVQRWEHATPLLHAWANNAFFFDAGSKGITVKNNISFDLPSKTPVRYNENLDIGGVANMAEGMEWENNYFFTDVTDADFPWDLAAKAGLEDEYKKKLIPRDAELDKAPSSERH